MRLVKVIFILMVVICSSCTTHNIKKSINVYVDVNGANYGTGAIDNPFNSLHQAATWARKFKKQPVYIWLRSGDYFLTETFALNKKDDRSLTAPLQISAYKNEVVTLLGAKKLPYWNHVVDEYALAQLPISVKRSVLVTNLKQYGITNFGSARGKGLALFHHNKEMQISRYPNQEVLAIAGLVDRGSKKMNGLKGSVTGKFFYEENLPSRWKKEKDIWLHGYWFWNWADQNQKVNKINFQEKIIELKKPYHYYGYRKGQEFYAYNLLSEIDVPNEWYLDRETGNLYFYPDGDISKKNPPVVSVISDLITLVDVSYVSIKNISLAAAKNDGITLINGSNNLIDNVVIKNIGNNGVVIIDSINSKIANSKIFSIGATAITIKGGKRDTLVASNICAINNEIHGYATVKRTYRPGISLNGVGNCAKNNEIYNAPHIGIFFSGNNHLIEYNNIHHVVQKSNDAGAIYTGRDWTARGNIIRFNYLHDIVGYKNNGAKGIYLDDEASGTLVSGNIFDNVKNATFIGGGKNNIVENNLFINSEPSIHIDSRGSGWAKHMYNQLFNKLNSVPYSSGIWKEKYPKLQNILEENTRLPVGNIVNNNIFYDPKWDHISSKARIYIKMKNNHFFVNEKPTLNYQLKSKVNGFQDIPFKRIGVQAH